MYKMYFIDVLPVRLVLTLTHPYQNLHNKSECVLQYIFSMSTNTKSI